MSNISFNTACKELKIAQIAQLNQLFQLLHLAHIHLFQKTLSESTANGNCRTEIARPKGTVVSISMSSLRGAKAWFPYRCICRVCRTKKVHRTATTL